MAQKQGYTAIPFTFNRRMVAATASVNKEQNTIYAMVEADITEARRFLREHKVRTGESLSLTAFVITCLARTVAENPMLNSFRKGGKLILLDDVTVGVLVEREIDGEAVPESFGIPAAQRKTYREIHDAIRAAQEPHEDGLGALSGFTWIRYIPEFLMRPFIRIASHNIAMAKRFGAVAVTAIGMYASKNQASWIIPLVGGATAAVAVGGIVERPRLNEGRLEPREHLCLTVSFNHDIIDGAPAARCVKRFSELLGSDSLIRESVNSGLG